MQHQNILLCHYLDLKLVFVFTQQFAFPAFIYFSRATIQKFSFNIKRFTTCVLGCFMDKQLADNGLLFPHISVFCHSNYKLPQYVDTRMLHRKYTKIQKKYFWPYSVSSDTCVVLLFINLASKN